MSYSTNHEVAALQKQDWWGEHHEWTRAVWRADVAEGGSQLGYWDWLTERLDDQAADEEVSS